MENTNVTVEDIASANIVRVYSGKPGCGCGCRGTYRDSAIAIKNMRKRMIERIGEVKEANGIFAIEDENRYYWAYTG